MRQQKSHGFQMILLDSLIKVCRFAAVFIKQRRIQGAALHKLCGTHGIETVASQNFQ